MYRRGMRSLMVSPTYQEAAGIEAFIERFGASRDDFGLLIVDDGSPDGTGAIVERLAETRPWLHLLSRSGKGGLGSSYRAGFAWALERDYELIGQIDANRRGQHPPEALVALRARLEAEGADVLIGSRYVVGGDTGDWPAYRRAMSGVTGWTTRRATGLRQRDLSGSFKLWRASALRAIDVGDHQRAGLRASRSRRPCAQHRAGLSIMGEPITFGVRLLGEVEAVRRRRGRGRAAARQAAPRPLVAHTRSVARGTDLPPRTNRGSTRRASTGRRETWTCLDTRTCGGVRLGVVATLSLTAAIAAGCGGVEARTRRPPPRPRRPPSSTGAATTMPASTMQEMTTTTAAGKPGFNDAVDLRVTLPNRLLGEPAAGGVVAVVVVCKPPQPARRSLLVSEKVGVKKTSERAGECRYAKRSGWPRPRRGASCESLFVRGGEIGSASYGSSVGDQGSRRSLTSSRAPSTTTSPDSFDSPTAHTKVIGSSMMLDPERCARMVVSIWKRSPARWWSPRRWPATPRHAELEAAR